MSSISANGVPTFGRDANDLVQELAETLAGLPIQPGPKIKEFTADSPTKARSEAANWLSDFSAHGPLEISSIRTTAHRGRFVAVVAYWNQT